LDPLSEFYVWEKFEAQIVEHLKKQIIMKKSFILPVYILALFCLTNVLTQHVYAKAANSGTRKMEAKTTANEKISYVSQKVKNSFHAEFGTQSNIQWSSTEDFDVASFTMDGQSINAYFTKDGMLDGRIYQKNWNDLPFQAQVNIIKRYKDYNVVSVFVYYGKTLSAFDNYFVGLSKDKQTIVVRVNEKGDTYLYKKF
jgi:hypothetical protein